MANKGQVKTLSEFARRALQSLEAKNIPKKAVLHIPSLDTDITIRSLNKAEVAEVLEQEDDRADRYCIYLACCSPSLRETAKELTEAGEIDEYLDVCDIFVMSEIPEIAMEIMKLSGVYGAEKVSVVEDIKN